MIHNIVCQGPCNSHDVLGTCELPDDTAPEDVAQALAPYLAEDCDCGPAYTYAVVHLGHPPGATPTKEHVKIYRKEMKHGQG